MPPLSKLPFGRLDPITYLPNRQQFLVDYQPAPGAQLVMMTLSDSKHFNQLLRAIGHEYSEDFLRAGAKRLREALPDDVPLYHAGMLSFAFLLPNGTTPDLLQKIITCFNNPIHCGRIPVTPDIALGIADCKDSRRLRRPARRSGRGAGQP
ncbi:MAG TPA: diguanylate cyclase [Acidocella sp.]|nr:MAG: hypothetical protein B7Z81_10180 [Acidocella sp. 20-61-6]HQT47840.1 diguanylate cyclase [Acidocella sp.]